MRPEQPLEPPQAFLAKVQVIGQVDPVKSPLQWFRMTALTMPDPLT